MSKNICFIIRSLIGGGTERVVIMLATLHISTTLKK